MEIIDKSMIETWILPHLTIGQRGFETTVSLTEVVGCIFHRLIKIVPSLSTPMLGSTASKPC